MESTLIYPHQLFARHPAIAKGRAIHLIEEPLFFGTDARWPAAMHRQKLMLHRASMKAYAADLKAQGHRVSYVEFSDALKLPKGTTQLHLVDPVDDVLMKRIRKLGPELVIHESPNFLTPRAFLETQIGSGKKPSMARFYVAQRQRMGLLLEKDGSPVGGKWSFDTENRAKLPKRHVPPMEPLCPGNAFTREAAAYVEKHFPDNPGSTRHFRWPVTREDAEAWLDRFIDERMEHFGIYEDAISTEFAYLHHSAITPALNIGLLDPQDVIDRVMAKRMKIPMNSLEGFVRQVIGWREFMRGIYQFRGVEIRTRNFWNFDRPLPASFYDGTTGIPPVDRLIRQLLTDGYCHHIERLMVLGNFMLLCRFRPDDVYRWFMEMFVDSYDWVMVPNVYGMSQFADGGTFTTKPYLSGSNYILKMSDERKGPWCEVWDGLFWTFIGDHAAFFLKNPRLSMMVRTWQKMPDAKKGAHRKAAEGFLGLTADGRGF
ncbi:MAG: cryptochrome/photolyase family protein [Oceanipulchritudo sp.]